MENSLSQRKRATFTALPYSWTQELGEVDVTVPVPKGTRGKQLNVVIQKKKLVVGLKGEEPILSGELCKEIKVEDSTWTLRKNFFKSSLCVSVSVTYRR